MLKNSPRDHEFFKGALEKPISPQGFLGKGFSQTPIKVLFLRDNENKNSGKDVSEYNDTFDILVKNFDFSKKEYRATIVGQDGKSSMGEIIGSFSSEGSLDSGSITEIKFYITGGKYPVKEEKNTVYSE